MVKKAKILELLEIVAPILPAPIYWENVDSVILGGNEPVIKATGAGVASAYIGKTLFELYPHDMAENIKIHNEEVMRTGKILSQEEVIRDIKTGELKYFTAIKAPLRDDDGTIIGIVGTSVDITAEKEAERLRLENEVQRNLAKEQEQFTEIANQVAHDIRSPLASLSMIVSSCLEIPERERVALREVSTRISDIANNLLQQYKSQDIGHSYNPQPLLLSATLLQFLTEKKYQYHERPIQFAHDISSNSQFSFIWIDASSFKRMMSNLVNNAVDALDNKNGKVIIKVQSDLKAVKVIIEDDGKGMSEETMSKIMDNIKFTEGKAHGHGIGLSQVRNTLKRAKGTLLVESKLGLGSRMILEFPRCTAPTWIADEIKLTADAIVVILDDDKSIHVAWDTRFEPILKKSSQMCVTHFEAFHDALEFITTLSPEDKSRVFLLTDYELLKQEGNGLDLVKKAHVQRAILVTSHYADVAIQKRAEKLRTKILPKQLASEIPIGIQESSQKNQRNETELRQVHAVIVDDDEQYVKDLKTYVFDDKDEVDYFKTAQEFKEKMKDYPKNTLIYLDNHLGPPDYIKGIRLAEELHALGFSNLRLLTGDTFRPGELPDFLTAVRKSDLDNIKIW